MYAVLVQWHRHCEVTDALCFWSGLRQVGQAGTFFPLSSGFEELDTFEALEDVALGANGLGRFKAWVLGHDEMIFSGWRPMTRAENSCD